MRVLIVDDQPSDRAMMVEAADEVFPSWDVEAVSSAHAALELLADTGPVDLLITDVVLGFEENGYDLAAAIKRQNPGTVVMIMTSSFSAIDSQSARRAGAVGMFAKPMLLEEYAKRMEEVKTSCGLA